MKIHHHLITTFQILVTTILKLNDGKLVNYPAKNQIASDTSLPLFRKATENYSYAYTIKGGNSGDDFLHTQAKDGEATTGEYKIKLPDGVVQVVKYTADGNGYRADIRYNKKTGVGKDNPSFMPSYHSNSPNLPGSNDLSRLSSSLGKSSSPTSPPRYSSSPTPYPSSISKDLSPSSRILSPTASSFPTKSTQSANITHHSNKRTPSIIKPKYVDDIAHRYPYKHNSYEITEKTDDDNLPYSKDLIDDVNYLLAFIGNEQRLAKGEKRNEKLLNSFKDHDFSKVDLGFQKYFGGENGHKMESESSEHFDNFQENPYLQRASNEIEGDRQYDVPPVTEHQSLVDSSFVSDQQAINQSPDYDKNEFSPYQIPSSDTYPEKEYAPLPYPLVQFGPRVLSGYFDIESSGESGDDESSHQYHSEDNSHPPSDIPQYSDVSVTPPSPPRYTENLPQYHYEFSTASPNIRYVGADFDNPRSPEPVTPSNFPVSPQLRPLHKETVYIHHNAHPTSAPVQIPTTPGNPETEVTIVKSISSVIPPEFLDSLDSILQQSVVRPVKVKQEGRIEGGEEQNTEKLKETSQITPPTSQEDLRSSEETSQKSRLPLNLSTASRKPLVNLQKGGARHHETPSRLQHVENVQKYTQHEVPHWRPPKLPPSVSEESFDYSEQQKLNTPQREIHNFSNFEKTPHHPYQFEKPEAVQHSSEVSSESSNYFQNQLQPAQRYTTLSEIIHQVPYLSTPDHKLPQSYQHKQLTVHFSKPLTQLHDPSPKLGPVKKFHPESGGPVNDEIIQNATPVYENRVTRSDVTPSLNQVVSKKLQKVFPEHKKFYIRTPGSR